MSDGNALLMGGGGTKWVVFAAMAEPVRMVIRSEPEQRQQRDYDDPSILLTWPDGNPRYEVVVEVDTDQRSADLEDDQGVRALHIKGASMTGAIRDAVRKARAPGLEVGGVLTVTWSGDGVATGRGKPPKLYAATYKPPAAAGNAALMSGHPAGTSVVTRPADDAPPAGMDAELWARMSGEQRDIVRAAAAAAASAPPF
jgi:hypothetical protein